MHWMDEGWVPYVINQYGYDIEGAFIKQKIWKWMKGGGSLYNCDVNGQRFNAYRMNEWGSNMLSID